MGRVYPSALRKRYPADNLIADLAATVPVLPVLGQAKRAVECVEDGEGGLGNVVAAFAVLVSALI